MIRLMTSHWVLRKVQGHGHSQAAKDKQTPGCKEETLPQPLALDKVFPVGSDLMVRLQWLLCL